jgi:hypothetical protein
MIRDVRPGAGSRIRVWILIFYPSRIPDSEAKHAPDPGSGSATLPRLNLLQRGSRHLTKTVGQYRFL